MDMPACTVCNDERVVYLQTSEDTDEPQACPECGTDDEEWSNPEDRPLPTEDDTGVREPD